MEREKIDRFLVSGQWTEQIGGDGDTRPILKIIWVNEHREIEWIISMLKPLTNDQSAWLLFSLALFSLVLVSFPTTRNHCLCSERRRQGI